MLMTSATGSRGFSLLELLVVLGILALVACSWPLFSSRLFPAQRLRNELEQLSATIRLAQITARTTGAAQQLQFSADGGSYSFTSEQHLLPDGLTVGLRNAPGSIAASQLILFPDGSSSGGVLDLSFQGRSETVRVLPATGRLEKSQ